ncbi:hypothetical protein M4I33_05155 [Clostridium sp. LY3-2]|uniref:hypothetical protein n=1 Tax=Clostridium sp. LY3-2 TaxID=2942482 RepID=UPI002152FD79|nr:hypothetical protein [Clostridium sp. LY3-2]MCR6514269.1 hypothetical protein [Clostridium sp. LY3-2]
MNRKIKEILDISLICINSDLFIEEYNLLSKKIFDKNEKGKYIKSIIYRLMKTNYYKNIDEVKLLLKKYYPFLFDESYTKKEAMECIYNILINYGKCLISHRDGEIVYKYWKNNIDDEFIGPYEGFKKIDVFRIMNSLVTIDVFTIIYLIENGVENSEQLDNYYSRIYLADDQLDKILKSGIAENHIHANAAFKFDFLWETLVNKNISKNQLDFFEKNKYIDSNNSVDNKMEKYILWTIFYRILILVYLKYSNRDINICDFYNEEMGVSNRSLVDKIISTLHCDFNDLSRECIKDSIDEIRKIYIILEEEKEENLVFKLLNNKKYIRTHGENIFLFELLKIYNEREKKDLVLFKSFLMYLRIKNIFYKKIVQNLTIKGLDNFSFYFGRSKKINQSFLENNIYYETLFRTNFQDRNLKKFELRLGILDSTDKFEKTLKNILKQYKNVIDDLYLKYNKKEFPKLGIVYHFIKKEDCSDEKCWLNEKDEFVRFKKIQDDYKQQLEALLQVRKDIPELSYFILGIDAASLENNTPVQIFAPIYNAARDSSIDVLTNYQNGDYIKNKSLKFTFHAGEDFRHMLSGMRRIEELLEHCKFKVGDRIGHGTVLGIDPDKWIKENPIVILPREEHLDNLLWIWGMYTKHINNNSHLIMYVEQEIYNLAKQIFNNMNGMNINILYEAYLKRFEKFEKNEDMRTKFCECDEFENSSFVDEKVLCRKSSDIAQIWNAEKIVHSYNCICYLKKFKEPIYVQNNDKYKSIIKDLRDIIINELAMKGIVVEINPTSNSFICEIDGLLDNQIYAINSINNMKNVMVNINTDDPLVLNNNISNEYCYMYYGMLERGVGREEALKWIDKIREMGMSTSFISDDISNEEYYKYLERIIERLK